jgi:ribonuclease Z
VIQPREVLGPSRPGRKIVYLGDVLPSDRVVALCQDADLLVCEATFCEDLADRARETGHSTVKQSCEIARRAKAKRLLLTHFSPRYDRQAIERELDFPGAIVGEDGFTVEVPYP